MELQCLAKMSNPFLLDRDAVSQKLGIVATDRLTQFTWSSMNNALWRSVSGSPIAISFAAFPKFRS
jgi:hypothetical protein